MIGRAALAFVGALEGTKAGALTIIGFGIDPEELKAGIG